MRLKSHSLRSQRTRAEAKANSNHRYYTDEETGESFNLYRAARSTKNLPNSWDREDWVRHQKNWKKKRKTKYYLPGEKGKKFTFVVNDMRELFRFERYCWDNKITCNHEEFGGQKKTHTYTVWSTKERVYTDSTGRVIHTYDLVEPKKVTRTYYVNRQYRVTYWSKVELDHKKICQSTP